MDAKEWETLGSLIADALALPPEQRDGFIAKACGTDTALRDKAKTLLAAHDAAPAYFERLSQEVVPSMATDDSHRLIGQTVGPYRVLEMLGGGGMGVVYKAEDTRLQRTVALKFLPPAWSLDDTARQRFLQEARAASALDHPNICTIYEINETRADQIFMVMACYEGQTLQEVIAQGPLSIDTALGYATQIAEGLAQAHAQGITHRDIKPVNVMVTSEGRIKILDFGLAKHLAAAHLTLAGTMLGTPAYMSPEQAQGEATDHRTDIWSLGVVLYELLSGVRPFLGDDHQAVLYGVVHHDPQPLSALRPDIPLQLTHAIHRALTKSREARYPHIRAFLEDLLAIRQRQAHQAQARESVLIPDPLPTARIHPEEGPLKILVVDDEPALELIVVQKFRHQIRTEQWSFVYASDGFEALERLDNDPEIALVLADLNMPRMDGLALLDRLADLDRPLKAIVVSAYGDMQNIRAAMNRGAFDFITKPVDFADLEATIRKARRELVAYQKVVTSQRQVVAMQQEMAVAQRIQSAMLPVAFPAHEAVDLYAFTVAAREVSGTFYDYCLIDDRRVGLVMGAVAEKGVSAALFTAISQTFLKGMARQGEAPGRCLTTMNQLLFPEGFSELSVAVFYGLLDLCTGVLSYSHAGNLAPYLLRATGSVAPIPLPATASVWQHQDQSYPTVTTTLEPGDGLVLFTQGLIEAHNVYGQPYGVERLAALLRENSAESPSGLIRTLLRTVMQHADGIPLTEDLTALAMRYLPKIA